MPCWFRSESVGVGTVAAGAPPADAGEVVQGAKGVSGGAVVAVWEHARA